ncbi:hypothetical protein [uncultured Campylobacter sp.]|uniref:hypothetical protein n=1 Tax=uncultured Campylobacter sp. TaxID=218934 RepID=UPI002629C166|nr:hypothetical protein [uncultured Campylobacter sp.]
MRKIIFSLILTIGASFAYDACDNKEVQKFIVDNNSFLQERKAYIAFFCKNSTMMTGTDLKRSKKISKKEAAYLKVEGKLDKIAADSICPGLDAFQDLGLNRKANFIYFFGNNEPFYIVTVDDNFCKKYDY